MSDDNKPVPQAGHEGPTSTTDEVLRLLHEQVSAPNDDGALDNRELEQLFGSLSKGLEEGIPDSALGIQPARAITLEELAAGLPQPLALGEIPMVQPTGGAGVTCDKCGFTNPELTRFCGMCGHEHSSAGKVSRDEGERADALQTSREVAASPPKALSSTNSGHQWKIACLGLLCMVLGFLVVYQQQWWRLPLLRNGTSSPLKAPAAPVPLATQPAPSNIAGGATPTAVQGTPSVGQPSISARPPKTAPPTTVKRALAEPTPLDSPSPQQIELPALVKLPDAGVPAASTRVEPESKPAQGAALPAPPMTIRIPQGVAQGALIHKVSPEYPAAARSARIQGSVVMNAIIGTDGTIQQLQLIKGNPLLVNAAMEAVKKWRYRPYLVDSQPVEIETTITVNFKGE